MSSSVPNLDVPDRHAIETAEKRIRHTVPISPLIRAHDLGQELGLPLWLKLESLQPTGSFKIRGATNWVRTASPTELDGGLITVSAGNHAQGLAWAARQADIPVTVVMPAGSSPLKIEATRQLGAQVIVEGTIQDAVSLTYELANKRGYCLVHPYDNPRVIAGQGTIGLELIRQLPAMSRILCPIGGGGLISGVSIAIKSERADVQVIGVEPAGAATMRNAWDHVDSKARLETVDTVASSLAPAVVGDYTYEITRRYVDDIVTVDDDSIIEATRLLVSRGRLYVEPGASVGIAALLSEAVQPQPERPTIAIVTGGNMGFGEFRQLS